MSNTTGTYDSAFGVKALHSNTTGDDNTASGFYALGKNFTGSLNIGLGVDGGTNIIAGSNNIEIWATPFPEFLPSAMNPTPFASALMARRKRPLLPGLAVRRLWAPTYRRR